MRKAPFTQGNLSETHQCCAWCKCWLQFLISALIKVALSGAQAFWTKQTPGFTDQGTNDNGAAGSIQTDWKGSAHSCEVLSFCALSTERKPEAL